WHNIEFRFGQGTGGAGPDGQGGWSTNVTGNTAPGFGIQVGNDSTTFDTRSDGVAGANATQGNYIVPIDNGSRSLFRTELNNPGLEIAVDENTKLIVGSITG